MLVRYDVFVWGCVMALFGRRGSGPSVHDRLTVYLDRLYGYACSLIRDPEAARDLVQTTAQKALSAKRVPTDESAYRAWLFVILRNCYRDEMRRRKQDFLDFDQPEESPEPGNKTDWSGVFSNERVLITQLTVRSCLERLRPDHREIIVLVDMMGFSYRECAEILDIPSGTVMSRLSRARKKLLEMMRPGFQEPMGRQEHGR